MSNQKIKTIEEKIYFRKNGFYIEYFNINLSFFLYLARKGLQFIFDIGLYVVVMMILWKVVGMPIWQSVIYIMVVDAIIVGFFMWLLKGRTLGMVLSGMKVCSYDAKRASNIQYVTRTFFSILHTIPIFGQVYSFVSLISAIFNRGLTVTDLFSKTQVLTLITFRMMKNIYKEMEDQDDEWRH